MLTRTLTGVGVLLSGAWLISDLAAQTSERTGAQVVEAQCSKCHASGVNGAPKIDDRAAWAPRMTNGVDATVRSAIRGHGAMPARGGLVDLTDSELRAAILYMFYPAGAALKAQAAPPPVRDPNHKTVGGVDFYLGISPAPLGRGYYYVSITLREGAAQAYVKDAAVEARAANAVTGGETKKLEPMTVEQALSYGNSFRMEGKEPYTISVRALRPGRAAPLETAFQFKP